MKHMKKVTSIIGITVIVSLFSLSLSFGALSKSNALTGVSVENRAVWKANIEKASTIAVDDNNVIVLKEPEISGNLIKYSIVLNRVTNYGQFQFNIKNDGNINARVKNIKIDGIDDYKQYVDVSLVNLKVGDVIKEGTLLNNIKVITVYKKQAYDENMMPKEIKLDNINIKIEFEKID